MVLIVELNFRDNSYRFTGHNGNGHIWESSIACKTVYGGHGFGERNLGF